MHVPVYISSCIHSYLIALTLSCAPRLRGRLLVFDYLTTFVSIPRWNSYREFPPPPAVSHSRFSERFRDFGILGISGRETLFADFCRNARPGTGSSTTLGPGPSVRSNFLAAWIVGLGPRELAQGPGVSLCLGCIGFSHAFRKYGRNA